MNRDGFEFDLVTQRFIMNRWETEQGKNVLERVVESIKSGGDARGVLDEYVLNHPENQDPYAHPYYPKTVMKEGNFWVLTHDDLSGIQLYSEEFTSESTFAKKSLNYAGFYNCKLEGVNLGRTSLTRTAFKNCNLRESCIAISGGYDARFINCDLKDACLTQTHLEDVDFSGSNLEGVYFELATLSKMSVSYLTKFDTELNRFCSSRIMPEEQTPEILKAIRIAYENSEIWSLADQFFFLERSANRKAILWKSLKENRKLSELGVWIKDWLWCMFIGYGIKPARVLLTGFVTALGFAACYYFAGNPGPDMSFATSMYYSFTTFATLGYGDLHYLEGRWIMRLVSTFEALLGATLIAVFVAVMARKLIRR